MLIFLCFWFAQETLGKGACAGAAGGAFIGGVTLGFPGATFGMLIGAAGGAVVGGIVGAFTD